MSLNDDLLADGEPEREFNPGIASRLPRKRVGAGALIRDDDGRLMMVETTYKPTLEIPGGLAEDGESPLDACARELREELGIEPAIGSLLVADWVPAHGPWPDGLMLVFDGGILRDEQLTRIKLQDEEISSYKFLTLEEIQPRVKPSFHRRLAACVQAIKAGRPLYLQFGSSPQTIPRRGFNAGQWVPPPTGLRAIPPVDEVPVPVASDRPRGANATAGRRVLRDSPKHARLDRCGPRERPETDAGSS